MREQNRLPAANDEALVPMSGEVVRQSAHDHAFAFDPRNLCGCQFLAFIDERIKLAVERGALILVAVAVTVGGAPCE